MKKALKFISLIIGWSFLWATIQALVEGVLYLESRDLIPIAFIMFLPLGILFSYLGQKYSSKKTKIIKSLEIFFILLVINGVFKLSTILMLIGIIFIVVGGIALFIISRIKLEGEFENENSFIH